MSRWQTLLNTFRTALHEFASSESSFRVLRTTNESSTPPKSLYILDSSFNPPTRAHLSLAKSALLQDEKGQDPKHLLLLLATQNADKAPKPASFEHRLVMMTMIAEHLVNNLKDRDDELHNVAVDVGVTKCPYFLDKANVITESRVYPNDPTQIHLIGFDTFTRLLTPAYYPNHTLTPLSSLFAQHRVRVTYRPSSSSSTPQYPTKPSQTAYLEDLANGKREQEGAKREWAERIEMVEGGEAEEEVSSTKVREAITKGDKEALDGLVIGEVAEWVRWEGLYREGM